MKSIAKLPFKVMLTIMLAVCSAAFVSCADNDGGGATVEPTMPPDGAVTKKERAYMEEKYAFKLNGGEKHQTINGFGASGAWWAQIVGGWENAGDIVKLLYDDAEGIGLNIFRYNIGGGLPNTARDVWRRAATLEVSPGVYDIERDKNALEILRLAIGFGADKNVVFANSPPARMTVSGKTSGGVQENESNLKPECEEDFVKYLADISDLLRENDFKHDYISPINEPQWAWGGENATQEGCHYEPEQIVKVGRALALELQNRQSPVRLSLAESGQWNDAEYTLSLYKRIMADDVLCKALDHYAVHSYWTSEKDRKSVAVFFKNVKSLLPFYQTEWCQMEEGRDMGIDGAIKIAREIHMDMTILSVAEWNWWLAVSFYDYNDGLIYADEKSHKFKGAKRLYALGNWSRFVKEGYRRVSIEGGDGIWASAYQNPDETDFVVVVINESEEAKPFGVEDFGSADVYLTDAEHDCLTIYETIDDLWAYNLPPKSVATFVSKGN